MLGSSLFKGHWYFTAELRKKCEIYSTSATPLKLPMSLLSLRQPPFHGMLWEHSCRAINLHVHLPNFFM